MIFGGVFKKWFGGGQRKRMGRVHFLQAEAQKAANLAKLNPQQGTTPGYLANDRNDDGSIDPSTETVFKDDFEGASTDVEGLAGFDENGDGVLDSTDPAWQKFGVWSDKNKNGKFDSGEFKSLTDLGIAKIDLSGGQANGLLNITYDDGRTGTLALSLLSGN